MILANSTVFTLAGGLVGAESNSGGDESCPSPCLRGVAGHIDGNLTEARQEMTRAVYGRRVAPTFIFGEIYYVSHPQQPIP